MTFLKVTLIHQKMNSSDDEFDNIVELDNEFNKFDDDDNDDDDDDDDDDDADADGDALTDQFLKTWKGVNPLNKENLFGKCYTGCV